MLVFVVDEFLFDYYTIIYRVSACKGYSEISVLYSLEADIN